MITFKEALLLTMSKEQLAEELVKQTKENVSLKSKAFVLQAENFWIGVHVDKLKEAVKEAIKNAIGSGYVEVNAMTDEELAQDLILLSSEVHDAIMELMTEKVKEVRNQTNQ